jgi:hypothetical protein
MTLNTYVVHFELDIEVNDENEDDAILQAIQAVYLDGGVHRSDVEYVELLEED